MVAAARRRQGRALGLGLALLVSLWFTGVAVGMGDAPRGLACPSGQTVWLRGRASPGAGLVVHFAGRAVGGGSAGADGGWAIPLTVHERPGAYVVTVVARQDGATVAVFTCYVDLPVGATATPSPTPPAPRTPLASVAPGIPTATSQALPPSPTAEPDETPTPSATATPGATSVATPSPAAPPPDPAELSLAVVLPDDPAEPGLFEYVIVENAARVAQSLEGWRLVHRETGESFAFPPLTLRAGEMLVVWSGDGEDDLADGTLFWPTPSGRWAPGQTVALVDPGGQLVSSLLVPSLPTEATTRSPGTSSVLRAPRCGQGVRPIQRLERAPSQQPNRPERR